MALVWWKVRDELQLWLAFLYALLVLPLVIVGLLGLILWLLSL